MLIDLLRRDGAGHEGCRQPKQNQLFHVPLLHEAFRDVAGGFYSQRVMIMRQFCECEQPGTVPRIRIIELLREVAAKPASWRCSQTCWTGKTCPNESALLAVIMVGADDAESHRHPAEKLDTPMRRAKARSDMFGITQASCFTFCVPSSRMVTIVRGSR
ncbi:hypothetical protein [Nitratireductor rhodophyticola]|uniref:hypothetical protein n=1 Tax=Nitratireductor rhodophyticola TaxID=2854036 RepID=UPI00300AA801